jgi:Putative sensor
LFFMFLSLFTGVFYFSWATIGVSLSAGFSILIIGLPFVMLFISTVYVLSLLEGRVVEFLLGERMPRRPAAPAKPEGLWNKFLAIVKDPHTWGTLLYMVLMLPLGIAYFTIAVCSLSFSVALAVGGFFHSLQVWGLLPSGWGADLHLPSALPELTSPLYCMAGILMFFLTLHLARGIGLLHAHIAKALLVRGS